MIFVWKVRLTYLRTNLRMPEDGREDKPDYEPEEEHEDELEDEPEDA